MKPEDLIRLRRDLAAIRERVEELRDAIQENAKAIRATEEAQGQKEPTGEPIQAVISYDDKTVGDMQEEQETQNSIKYATWAAVIAAAVYATITLFMYCEMRKSTNAALKSVKITEDTAKKQLRAYVLFDHGEIVLTPDGQRYQVSVWMKNGGQTPAYNVTHWWNTTVRDDDIRQPKGQFYFQETSMGSTTDLGAGTQWLIPDDVKELRQIANHKVYAWGLIKYRDVYQRCQAEWFYAKKGRPDPLRRNTWALDIIRNVATDSPDDKTCKDGKFNGIEDTAN